MKSKTAFVCPLSWGLGHATRCIPVVMALQDAGFNVILGGNGRSGLLLKQRFPELTFIDAPLRDVKLFKKLPAWASVLLQMPMLLSDFKRERAFAQQVAKQMELSVIISDNRYGLYCSDVKSILITHQLRMMHPTFCKPFESITEWVIAKLASRFSEVWMPDYSNDENLTGALSHSKSSKQKGIKYIGPLSRLSPTDTAPIPAKVVVIISGPNPLRQQLEDRIKHEALKSKKQITIIGGKPEDERTENVGSLSIFPHLNDEAFAKEVTSAEYVIASGGYSTIMDLVSLGCCATLIPFKGQTEQEYLAARLHGKGQFSTIKLSELNFESIEQWGLSNIKKECAAIYPCTGNALEIAISNLLDDKENA